ncbi:MAG: porin family protein [Pseudomonadota bacterium]
MRYVVMGAAALAMTSVGAPAVAQEQCFDKGTLSYVDCPQPAPPPAPVPPPPVIEDGFYIGLKGGPIFPLDSDGTATGVGAPITGDIEFDPGWTISGVVGYEFHEIFGSASLRPELEFGYQTADLDGVDGDLSTLFGFANLYVDIPVASGLDLILGGGVGYGQTEADLGIVDDDDGSFGFHLDAGFGYDLTEQLVLDLTYRYSSFQTLEYDFGLAGVSVEADDFSSHQGLIGLRYKFY